MGTSSTKPGRGGGRRVAGRSGRGHTDPEQRLDLTMPVPDDLHREKMLVGLALDGAAQTEEIAAHLAAEDFRDPRLGAIWEACLTSWDTTGEVHPNLVFEVLSERAQLEYVGGAPALHTLWSQRSGTPGYWIEQLLKAQRRRAALEGTVRAHQLAIQADWMADPDAAAAMVEQAFTDALTSRSSTAAAVPVPLMSTGLDAHLAELAIADENVLPTGLSDLDRLVKIRPGELIIVAARPSVGKTLLGLRFARHVAFRHQRPALFVSLEMSPMEMRALIYASEANIERNKLLPAPDRPELTELDLRRLHKRSEELANAPLYVDVADSYSVGSLRSRLRQLQRLDKLPALVVVDYLGLMELPVAERKDLALGEAGRMLKLTAREFDVPIVAIHQMNREVEKRQDKRPLMSDLHNSGALEQHANTILFLVPEQAEDGTETGVVTLHIAKNRSGPRGGTIDLVARGHYGDIAPFAAHHSEWSA